jgi:hypothetical protein
MATATARSASVQRHNPWPWIALSVAILAGAAVVVVLLLRDGESSGQAVDYRAKIATVLEPLAPANDALSDDLEGLVPGDSSEAALASATVALSDTRAARRELAALRLPSEAFGLRADSEDALRREAGYLVAVRTALGEGSGTIVEDKATAARMAWRRVAREIPEAGGRIAGIDTLLAWDSAVPSIPDGDSGPGTSESPADLPAAPSVHVCGDATGVNDVVGVGIGCAEAFDIAAKARVAKNAAGVNGYICSGGGADAQGIEWSCDGPAGERVTFYAVDP